MTLKQARNTVRELGFTLRHNDGEYRLCPIGCREQAAYYTDDRDDAVATARNWGNSIRLRSVADQFRRTA